MRVADFYCGGGGFSEGFRQAGFEIEFAVDKWLPAVNTFTANKPNTTTVLLDDVIRLSYLPDEEFHRIIPDTEVIIGSPPCIAFSNSNKSGQGDKELGIKLLKAYLRIIARKKFKDNSILRYWVLENVPNIKNYINDEYTAQDLEVDGNFILKPKNEFAGIYNAKYFGAPTNRKRFLCGEFPRLTETHTDENIVCLGDVLACLGEPCGNQEVINDLNYPGLSLPATDVSDFHYKYILPEFEWKKAKRLKEDKGYMGKMSFPEDTTKAARTVMATMSSSSRESMILANENGGYRLPTVREVATMTSFPIDYRFYGKSKGIKYTLVGNAVPPKLSYAIATAILRDANMPIPVEYPKINHDPNINFLNLNFTEIQAKIEKPKKLSSKFKYHIPYLIMQSYRVELTNKNSDFKKNIFKWTVEIHHSQGKDKAKISTPSLDNCKIEVKLYKKINSFIEATIKKLCSYNDFQKRYCMTDIERKKMVGPNELLYLVKGFIDTNISQLKDYSIKNKEALPKPILVGYYILNKILKLQGEINE